jgi:hypothetical protein
MGGLNKDQGFSGNVVQVFVPNLRTAGDTFTVKHGQTVRFSADGRYELDSDGVKIPFAAGMTMGIPYGVTELKVYDLATGNTLTAQALEVM